MFIKRSLKVFVIVIVAFAFASVATAYAGANTVGTSLAGDGEGTISGYGISAVQYTLNASNPANIDSVSFTTAPAVPVNSTVKIQLASGGNWYTCSGQPGTSITCATTSPQATVLLAVNLRVVIAN